MLNKSVVRIFQFFKFYDLFVSLYICTPVIKQPQNLTTTHFANISLNKGMLRLMSPWVLQYIFRPYFFEATQHGFILAKVIAFFVIQSNLYKTTTLGTAQKWSSWKGGRLIKNLYQATTNQIWSFLPGFSFFLTVNVL